MSLQLTVRANYRESGDVAELLVYLYEDSDKKYHPEKLISGVVDFFSEEDSGVCQIARMELTKYNGNSDGAFRCFLLHPEVIDTLRFKLVMQVEGDIALTKSGSFEFLPAPQVETDLPAQPSIEKPSFVLPGKNS